ncbi:hypothetical protein [Actinomadura luteofluorescens]|uniref:hypothetical protein n=1 Tax=Actinomadura luteofluorescens TaxID=46163 RepID=UPI003D8B2A34
MNRQYRPWRAMRARPDGSPFGGLSKQDKKVLAMVVFSDVTNVAKGYFLVAVGVTEHVGAATTALVSALFAGTVYWTVYRPSWQTARSMWKTVLPMGISLAANHIAYQYVLRWVSLQILAPLMFVCTAVFMMGPDVVRDIRKQKYSTVFWPLLALLGTLALVNDSAVKKGGGGFSDTVPDIHVLGQGIPAWCLGVGVVVFTAATYALHNWFLATIGRSLKGKVNTLAFFVTLPIFATVAWTEEGGSAVITSGSWPYLLICAGTGAVGTLLSGVVIVKAYEQNLRVSAKAMLSPLNTLAGILLGMLIAQTAPGPLGAVAICVVLVASYGAAKYQSRNKSGSD